MNKISQFPQFIAVTINFVIFRLVSCTKLALDHVTVKFHAADGAAGTRVNFIYMAQYSLGHDMPACLSDNRVKSRV